MQRIWNCKNKNLVLSKKLPRGPFFSWRFISKQKINDPAITSRDAANQRTLPFNWLKVMSEDAHSERLFLGIFPECYAYAKNQNDSAINSRNIADHIILQSDRLTIVPDYPHPKEDPGLFCLSCIFV